MVSRKCLFLRFCFAAFFFLGLGSVGGAAFAPPPVIRVAIVKGVDTLRLDGTEVLALDENRRPFRLDFPVQVKIDRRNLVVDGRSVQRLLISAPVPIAVNGKRYRGLLEIYSEDKGLIVVNELPLEDYLVGLINCEISSQWPMEAVKAQAVVARTYAVYQKEMRAGSPYHLESTVMDQVYEGSDIEDGRAARGVRETAGEVVTYNGKVIQSFFHSNCGGRTESADQVWGSSVPYLQGVECRYCGEAPSARWETTLPLKKIDQLLRNAGLLTGSLKELRAGSRNRSGRLMSVTAVTSRGNQEIPAVKLRKFIGYTVIKSTNFEIKMSSDDITFTGAGYGHGVGLCQWGAKNRSVDGFTYREIIQYYYPGVLLEKLYAE